MKNELIVRLEEAFVAAADRERATAMCAYMKDLFPFYGIPAPERSRICVALFREVAPGDAAELELLAKEMWSRPQREWHYAAILLLARHKKLWSPGMIRLSGELAVKNSWWDSVDGLCGNVVSPCFLKFPPHRYSTLEKWENSGNMWLIRMCIIHQLPYRQKTDVDYLAHIIERNADSKAFFIQKAIGWALRQYAKTDPDWVKGFVERQNLKPLSRREALKNIV